ncbi:hypothetical protein COU18_02725 [Candidatus Kaiserbacteria bacterium CG10_big_fil_rev_8_21_14_0_10_51_14]|uniref:RNA polymerase sigma-70 region 2 domain-containing protein n=1 Tax=Candidatus Kaiserbacteria bacterium CG10_big_fil_rev_8_21_14_0_10_51_14 TaxID=1974610 RepID=A0A2H0UAX2_9BACT|nr:MAG: hypothetical protein COU18_02725 [Candidatus Kaiserbacteria bacterium CG10_big_fil_rev_8_21_14_0_10_51_14]
MVEKMPKHPERSTDAYTGEIRKIELLTAEEERELGRRIVEHDDNEARKELVRRHLRFAKAYAKREFNRLAPSRRHGISDDDFTQLANVGLMEAAERFDYRKARFATYAKWWMRSSMTHALEKTRLIQAPANIRDVIIHINRASHGFVNRHNRLPTAQELAAATGYSEGRIETALQVLRTKIAHFDQPMPGREEESESLGDTIADNSLTAEQLLMARDEMQKARLHIQDIMRRLEKYATLAQVSAFKAVYGPDGYGDRKSIVEVAATLGMSKQNVQQTLKAAWTHLRYRGPIGWGQDPLTKERERVEMLESLLEGESK